ncbi:hypothetical protein AB0I28_33120 [Phytomonospora sp. NPDC050363]|uniref:hypothetical protein n=1 Tax=Phytomonospora sp. NPDC050363 TaxID=3155642 RepID=UPI0033DC47DD
MTLRRLRARLRDDTGRVSLFFAIVSFGLLTAGGLAVDGPAGLRALARADNIAAEAARTAGQQLDPAKAIPGGPKVVDPEAATAAALNYIEAAGATGTVSVDPALNRLNVTVEITYDTIVLGLIGRPTITVTGSATAEIVTG